LFRFRNKLFLQQDWTFVMRDVTVVIAIIEAGNSR
jgi:hypothetical protein